VDVIAELFDPSHQPIHHMVPALFVNVGSASCMVRLLPLKHVKRPDHHRVRHSHNGAFPPSTRR